MKSTNEIKPPLRYVLGILTGIFSGILFTALTMGVLKLGDLIVGLIK
jgi:hypothetical protein